MRKAISSVIFALVVGLAPAVVVAPAHADVAGSPFSPLPYTRGPFATEAECVVDRDAWLEAGGAAGVCYYQDKPQSWLDGWYYRHNDIP